MAGGLRGRNAPEASWLLKPNNILPHLRGREHTERSEAEAVARAHAHMRKLSCSTGGRNAAAGGSSASKGCSHWDLCYNGNPHTGLRPSGCFQAPNQSPLLPLAVIRRLVVHLFFFFLKKRFRLWKWPIDATVQGRWYEHVSVKPRLAEDVRRFQEVDYCFSSEGLGPW